MNIHIHCHKKLVMVQTTLLTVFFTPTLMSWKEKRLSSKIPAVFRSKKVTMVAVPDDDNSVFKPSTHVMRRDDSTLGTMTTATELRHHEKLHEHQEEDETS